VILRGSTKRGYKNPHQTLCGGSHKRSSPCRHLLYPLRIYYFADSGAALLILYNLDVISPNNPLRPTFIDSPPLLVYHPDSIERKREKKCGPIIKSFINRHKRGPPPKKVGFFALNIHGQPRVPTQGDPSV